MSGLLLSSPFKILSEKEASSSPKISFSDLPSGFDIQKIYCTNVLAASDNQAFKLKASTNNGSSYLISGEYSWQVEAITQSSQTLTNGDASTIATLTGGIGNVSGEVLNTEITLFGMGNSSLYKTIHAASFYTNENGKIEIAEAAIALKTTTAINYVELLFTSVNITSGEFKHVAF